MWEARALETLFTWMPYLLPKHFCSFVLDLKEDLQRKIEEELNSQPWVFAFADVRLASLFAL